MSRGRPIWVSRTMYAALLTGLIATCVACTSGPADAIARVTAAPVAPPEPGVRPVSNSRDSFPSERDTGVDGNLATYTGPLVITQPNTVVENVEIVAPQVQVAANNVTFRNVRFIYSGGRDEKYAMVAIDPRFRGTLLENCEIDGRDGTARAVSGAAGVTVRACDIHNTGNGVEVQEDFTVEDSYLHDIFTPEGLGWHADGVQARDTGVRNIRIVNNTILLTGDETAAVHIISRNGRSKDILVAGNLLGGGGYTLYVGASEAENFIVSGNALTDAIFPNVGRWGAWFPGAENVAVRGNFLLGSGAQTGPADK